MWYQNPSSWETIQPNYASYGRGGWVFHIQQHIETPDRIRVLAEHPKKHGSHAGELKGDSFAYEVSLTGRHFCDVMGKQQPKRRPSRPPSDVMDIARGMAEDATGIFGAPEFHTDHNVVNPPPSFVEKEMQRRAEAKQNGTDVIGGLLGFNQL